MTSMVLLNTTTLGDRVVRGGELVTDAGKQAQLLAGGGLLGSISNPGNAAAQARAGSWRLKGKNELEVDVMLLSAALSAGAPVATMPATQASPVTGAYAMQPTDLWVPVTAGAIVTMPASPVVG